MSRRENIDTTIARLAYATHGRIGVDALRATHAYIEKLEEELSR